MRLIDADKLEVKHFVQRTEKIIGYDGTQPRYELKDVLAYAIDDAPTVKAIPVEWIEDFLNKITGIIDGEDISQLPEQLKLAIGIINLMEREWEKENEESLAE